MPGLVLRVDAKVCHVEIDGKVLVLPLSGKLFGSRGRGKRPIAVGDRVELRGVDADAAIERVLPRDTQLVRRSSGEAGHEHVIAANVSLMLVVAALRDPELQVELIDRMLAGAEAAAIPAALVLTKVDLDHAGLAAELRRIYEPLGYRVFTTSMHAAPDPDAQMHELTALLHENRSVLCGASGIGKSSLINRLLPGLGLRTGEVSKAQHGRHTTSHTQLIPLTGGGHVLDTPGIRGFDLFEVPRRDVARLFREFASRADRCAFRDCSHVHEPRCAVRTALTAGEIAASRYESYVALLAQDE